MLRLGSGMSSFTRAPQKAMWMVIPEVSRLKCVVRFRVPRSRALDHVMRRRPAPMRMHLTAATEMNLPIAATEESHLVYFRFPYYILLLTDLVMSALLANRCSTSTPWHARVVFCMQERHMPHILGAQTALGISC
jgi:hypothetical protein